MAPATAAHAQSSGASHAETLSEPSPPLAPRAGTKCEWMCDRFCVCNVPVISYTWPTQPRPLSEMVRARIQRRLVRADRAEQCRHP
eukprot:3071605-Rhodomonas_salina.2